MHMRLRAGAVWACLAAACVAAACGVARSAVIHTVLPAPAVAQGVYRLDQFGRPNPDMPGVIPIDLDGDGTADFQATSDLLEFGLSLAYVGAAAGQFPTAQANVRVDPASLALVDPFVVALRPGDVIGPAGTWLDSGQVIADSEYYPPHAVGDPLWQDQAEHYVGLRLTVNGADHYGWLGVSAGINPEPQPPVAFGDPRLTTYTLRVSDWAYETNADVPITAGAVPEPATFITFVAGAGALGIRRRRRGASSPPKKVFSKAPVTPVPPVVGDSSSLA